MIIIFKENAPEKELGALREEIKSLGLEIHESVGEKTRLWGLVGDTSRVDMDWLSARQIVDEIQW